MNGQIHGKKRGKGKGCIARVCQGCCIKGGGGGMSGNRIIG